MGAFSGWHLLILLLVVVLVFGTKKLRNIGSDLGSAVKGFKDGMRDATEDQPKADAATPPAQVTNQGAAAPAASQETIDVQAKPKD